MAIITLPLYLFHNALYDLSPTARYHVSTIRADPLTSASTASLISLYSSCTRGSSSGAPWKSAMTESPSTSWSVSMRKLPMSQTSSRTLRSAPTHRGDSGVTKLPMASTAPPTHWMNRGSRHDQSDRKYEHA
jgi:hypothetical protein